MILGKMWGGLSLAVKLCTVVPLALLVWAAFATRAEQNNARQARSECDQLRSTLARATSTLSDARKQLDESKKETVETRKRLAKLEQTAAESSTVTSAIACAPAPLDSAECRSMCTKVAVLNLAKVLESYQRVDELQNQLVRAKQKVEADILETRKKIDSYEPLPADPEERVQAEKELKLLRELADRMEERKQLMDRRADEDLESVFKDVKEAARVFARSRNFDLVISFNDSHETRLKQCPVVSCGWWCPEKEELTARQIRERISRSGVPIYTSDDVDISADVLHVLNWNYEQSQNKAADDMNCPTCPGQYYRRW